MTKKKKKKAKKKKTNARRPAIAPTPARDIVGRARYDHQCRLGGCQARSFGIPIPRELVPRGVDFLCVMHAAAFVAGADLAQVEILEHAFVTDSLAIWRRP